MLTKAFEWLDPKLFRAALVGMLSVLILACSKKGTPVVTEFSTINQTDSNFQYQLYALNSSTQESAYIGSLQWSVSGLEWPTSLAGYFNAMNAGAQPVQYYIKAYSASGAGANGDLYFEAPVIGKDTVLNGPSTALWYALRTNAAAQSSAVRLSTTGWQNLLFELNATCPDCLSRSGSAAFQILQNNQPIQTTLNQVLAGLGDVPIDPTLLKNPGLGIGYSTPALVQGSVNLAANQGQIENFHLFYFDPLNLAQRIAPGSWAIQIGSGTPIPIAAGGDTSNLTWIFDSRNIGAEAITATQSARGAANTVNYAFQVAFATFPPVLNIPLLHFQANHDLKINLSPYATDPRGEAMTYSLIQGPTGMTLNGTVLEWNPTQEPVSQVGTNTAEIAVTNTDGAMTAQLIQLNVAPDNYPGFSPGIPATWSLQEGTTGHFNFTALDPDNDPVEVTCVAGCARFVSGTPTGAGWPVLFFPNASIYGAMTGGSESVSIPFMPSYLQTIGSNSSVSIVLSLNYPTSSTNLRQVYTPVQQSLTLQIQNVADPPVWQVQPASSPSPSPTEQVAMAAMAGGTAIIPGSNPPSDSNVTYTINNLTGTPGNASNCAWVTLNPTGAVAAGTPVTISGTPPYTSAGTCKFTIRATDVLGLYADSSPVTIPVVNVPRPVVASGSIPNQTANEGQAFSLDLSPYFNDPDFTQGDPREQLTFTCLNCGALGIPTSGQYGASFSGTKFLWTPYYTIAPTGGTALFSGIQVQVTNVGGYTATLTFNLTVNDQPAPMAVGFANGTLAVTASGSGYATSLNAGSTGTVTLQIANIGSDTSAYNYTIATSCAPSCSAGIASLSTTSGVSPGTTNVTLTLSPTYADGYGGASSASAVRQITVSVKDSSNPSIVGTAILTVTVNTRDRPLTALVLNGDSGAGTYNWTIDGSAYSSNTINLSVQGPDATNDSFSYSFVTPPGFGALSGSTWAFNPVTSGCAPGNMQVVKNFGILATSSHGATITRNVSVTINKAQTGGGGSCPY